MTVRLPGGVSSILKDRRKRRVRGERLPRIVKMTDIPDDLCAEVSFVRNALFGIYDRDAGRENDRVVQEGKRAHFQEMPENDGSHAEVTEEQQAVLLIPVGERAVEIVHRSAP